MVVSPAGRTRVIEGLRLVGLLGRGGEGEVWEARDGRGRLRALKLVRPECLAEPHDATVRGAWLTRIDHPALVRVFRTGLLGAGELHGWGFVEMALVAGEDLGRAPADVGVLERLEPLAEGLDLLHAGVWSDGVPLVHRDVKPANIVESRDSGTLVLVDPSTLRGVDATLLTRIGTPVFSAPEVATGRIGPAADVYSFAATVVALATGLRGSELADALLDPERLDLPGGVRDALSSAPGGRPASCRGVLEEGEAITLLQPVAALWQGAGTVVRGRTARVERTAVLWPRAQPAPRTAAFDLDEPRQGNPPSGLPARHAEPGDEFVPAPARPPPVLPWVTVLAALTGLPAVAVLAGVGSEGGTGSPPVAVLALVAAAHLVGVLAARGSLVLALVPPLAWARLLGRRVGGGALRRLWTTPLLLLGTTGMFAATLLAVLRGDAGAQLSAALGAGGLAAVLLVIAAARERGVLGWLLRLVAGTVVLGAGALAVEQFMSVLPPETAGAVREALRLAAARLGLAE